MKKFALYHVGVEGCDKVAFYTTRRLIAMVDSINAKDVIHVDGTNAVDYEPMICGSCGKGLTDGDLEYRDAT